MPLTVGVNEYQTRNFELDWQEKPGSPAVVAVEMSVTGVV